MSNLTACERLELIRHKDRPTVNDYIPAMFTRFMEFHGDRLFGDDAALLSLNAAECAGSVHKADHRAVELLRLLCKTERLAVSLRVGHGEIRALVGENGAGKSTLLRSVNRMHQITSGTLTVNGTDVSTLSGKSLRRFRRGIGMVFQSFNLVTRTTVIKNVLSACVPDMPFWRVLLGAFRKEDKIKALESLDKVGILDKAYMRADQLSGGQQQRVALARTLTQDPQIILADEPVAALDPVTAKQVMQDFVRINKEMGISILLNIHHVELALEYAARDIVISVLVISSSVSIWVPLFWISSGVRSCVSCRTMAQIISI